MLHPADLLETKGKDVTFYDTIMLDDAISGTLDLEKQMVLSVDGEVMAASDDSKDIERADFLNKMFYYMLNDIWSVFDNMLDAKQYGFKVGEIMWDVGKDELAGKWIIKNIKPKHSVLFDFDYDEWGMLDKLYIGYKYGDDKFIQGYENIMNKFLILVWPYPKDGNWYGNSVLNEIYLQYYHKFNILRWRGVYLQNFGMPVIEAKYDQKKTSATEKAELNTMLKNWQDTMFFLTPSLRDKKDLSKLFGKFEFILHEVKGTSTEAYEKAIQQLDASMKRRLLFPDNVGYTETQRGSFAKSKTEFDVLMTVIRNHHGKLEDMINPLIRKVEKINFGNVKDHSEWKFRDINKLIEKDLLQMAIEKGVIDKREKWIRAYTGMPEITVKEEEEIAEEKEKDIQEGLRNRDLFAPKDKEEKNEKGKEDKSEFKKNKMPFDYKKAKEQYETFENEFIDEYKEIYNANIEKLIKKIKQKYDLEKKDYKWIDGLRINKTPLKNLIELYLSKLFVAGKISAIEESRGRLEKAKKEYKNEFVIKRGGFESPEPGDISQKAKEILASTYASCRTQWVKEHPDDKENKSNKQRCAQIAWSAVKKAGFKNDELEKFTLMEESWKSKEYINAHLEEYGDLGALTREDIAELRILRDKAYLATGMEETRVLKEMQAILIPGLNTDKPLKDVIGLIERNLRQDRKRYATTIARTNASTAYNSGRSMFFKGPAIRPFVEAFQYSAIMDDRTTEFCIYHDEQILKKGDPQLSAIEPPNHFNCRSVLTVIFIEEKNDPKNYFYDYENKFEAWGQNVPADIMPAKGF